MRHTYYKGYSASPLFYRTEEEFKLIKSGTLFKVGEVFDWYLKFEQFENGTGEPLPEGLVCLKQCYNSSRTAKRWGYFMLKQDDKAKVYFGDQLKDHLVDEVGYIMNDLNSKMKYRSGRDFKAYVNAIPTEIIVDEDFCKRIKKKIRSVLGARIKNLRTKNLPQDLVVAEISLLQKMSEDAQSFVDNANKKAIIESVGVVKCALSAEETLEIAGIRATDKLAKKLKKQENNENKVEEKMGDSTKITFGQFSDKVVEEFKLDAIQGSYRIRARVADGIFMMMNWRAGVNLDKEVDVWFKVQYGLRETSKFLGFSHKYKLRDIVDSLDDFGIVENPQDLPVERFGIKLIKTNYNLGKQMNGFDFDEDKFIGKMFKKCEADNKGFKPRCVVSNIEETNKNKGK